MKILFKKDGYIVGITDEGKFFESYKNINSINILGGAGMYIQELQKEIERLKIKKALMQINKH